MTLLEFARGPAWQASVLILIAGMAWRVVALLLLRRRPQLAAPRHGLLERVGGGVGTILTRFAPRRAFWPRIAVSVVLSATFHIGLAIILFGGAPHIRLIRQCTGLSWPGLPKGVIVIVSGVTLASMIALLLRRIHHPVLRLLSNADDYLSWLLVFLPVLTGILLSGETIFGFGDLLALHILSAEGMIVWLPFGKLMHAVLVFAGRGLMGMNFSRKGAAT
jgi:nitrate reductase gamma subunit